jgi:peptide/nickel transport system permease protein
MSRENPSAIAAAETEALGPSETPLQEIWRFFRRDLLAMLSLSVLLLLVVTAIAGKLLTEWIVVFDPATVRLPEKLLPPLARASASALEPDQMPALGLYLFGTDDLGRDIFARMLQGAFVSLSIGFVAVGISISIGILLGGLAGLLPPSIFNIMVVIGLTSWMGTARFVRAEFLSLRDQDFVVAAHALGLPERRILFRHMVPNAIAPVLVSATIGVATAILTESGLSFLGFGVQPPDATWGNILADGRPFIFDAPWLFVVPGVAILIVVLAFNLVGEGLREALNPRLRRNR